MNLFLPSPVAIIVKLSNDSTVGHVPDPLVCVLGSMLGSGEIAHMSGTINGVPRPAPEGAWVSGGKMEILCDYQYVLYGACEKGPQRSIWQRLRDAQKSWKLPRTKDCSKLTLFIV